MKMTPVVQVLIRSLGSSVERVEPHGVSDVMHYLRDVATAGLRYWELKDDTTGMATSGYTLEPAIMPFNATASALENSAEHNAAYGSLDFLPLYGNAWAVVTPDYEPYTSALRWYNSAPDGGPYVARTASSLPQGQDFAVQLHTFGYTRQVDNEAHWQIGWGNRYSIRVEGGGSTWLYDRNEAVRQLPLAAEDFGGAEPTWLKVYHIAGRVVLDVERGKTSQRTVYTDIRTQTNADDPYSNWQPEMRDATPRSAAPIIIQGQGVPFAARVHEIQYPETGALAREYQTGGHGSPTSSAFGHASVNPTKTAGAVATIEHTALTDRTAAYTATLERQQTGGADDVMQGHSTPFLSCVSAMWEGNAVSTDETWLDLTSALLSVTVETPDPRIGGGTKATLRLRTDLLPSCTLVDDEGRQESWGQAVAGADWANYLARYHRAHIRVAWQYDDGTAPKAQDPVSGVWMDCAHVFDGYVWSVGTDVPGYGQSTMSVTLRDGLCRFEKPAGLINQRFVSGDMLLAQQGPGGRLFGSELVGYIAGTCLGADGPIEPALMGFFPDDHYDLMQYKQLVDPPFQTGFFFPPPWGQSAADWIKQIAEVDFAVFFFGHGTDTSSYCPAWVPWYGDYFTIFSLQTPITIQDYAVVEDDANSVVGSYSWEHESSRDYNRVEVWGKYPQDPGGYQDIMPALPAIMGAATVETSIPEQDPAYTWDRTLLLQGTKFWRPMVARVVATLTARLLRNVVPKRVTVKLRGEPGMFGGYKVYLDPAYIVDPEGVDPGGASDIMPIPSGTANPYRVMRVRHDIDMVRKTFDTTLSLAPEPNTTT